MTKRGTELQANAGRASHETFRITVVRTIKRARTLRLNLSDKEVEQFTAAALEAHTQAIAEISAEAYKNLPFKSPRLFLDHFKSMREAHRARFLEREGRKPFPNNDREDYTPVHFLQEVYGRFVDAGVITAKYLEKVLTLTLSCIGGTHAGAAQINVAQVGDRRPWRKSAYTRSERWNEGFSRFQEGGLIEQAMTTRRFNSYVRKLPPTRAE